MKSNCAVAYRFLSPRGMFHTKRGLFGLSRGSRLCKIWGFSHFPYWASVSGHTLFSYFKNNCWTISKGKIRGEKIRFSPHVVCCSCCLGEDPAVPMFKKRLGTWWGRACLFLRLVYSVASSSKKKKKKPQVWPACKALGKKSSRKLNRIWLEFVGFDVGACPRHAAACHCASWVDANQAGFTSLGCTGRFSATLTGSTGKENAPPVCPCPSGETGNSRLRAWSRGGIRGGQGWRRRTRTVRTFAEEATREGGNRGGKTHSGSSCVFV